MLMRFFELLEDSVILQAILTVSIWGAVIYLALVNRSIPDLLGTGAGVILGYYFGNKQAQAVRKALESRQ